MTKDKLAAVNYRASPLAHRNPRRPFPQTPSTGGFRPIWQWILDIHHRFRGASPEGTGSLGWGESNKPKPSLQIEGPPGHWGLPELLFPAGVLISLQLLACISRPSFYLKNKVDRTAVVTSVSSDWWSPGNMGFWCCPNRPKARKTKLSYE